MSNIQRLAAEDNKNHRLFASTIIELMNSQGFYGRLYRTVNDLSEDGYNVLYSENLSVEESVFQSRPNICSHAFQRLALYNRILPVNRLPLHSHI